MSWKPEVFHGYAYLVDGPAGTFVVPQDVSGYVGGKDWPGGSAPEEELEEVFSALKDYTENRKVWTIEYVKGWIGRYHMPGYLDSSDWNFDTNKRELIKQLKDYYGNEEDGEEE